jgi:hypothetical protein
LPAFFYESALRSRPVRAWILGLPSEDRKLVGRDTQKVEFGWPLGLPYCHSLGNGLWEVMSDLTDGKTGRVFSAWRENEWCCCTGNAGNRRWISVFFPNGGKCFSPNRD